MRKIFVVIGVIVAIFIVNFSLWVAHTRTIHRAVTVLKHNLAFHGVNFYYDDLYFDSFKSWSVEGTLKNVTITNNLRNVTRVIEIQAVNFISLPFSEKIEINIPKSVDYKVKANGESKDELYRINFSHGNPTLEIDFITSLNSTNDAFSDHIHNPFFVNIKKLSYYDSGFEITNRETGENYMRSENNKWELLNVSKDGALSVNFEAKFSDMSNTPRYIDPNDMSEEFKHRIKAKSDFYTKGNFAMVVSDEQLEYIKEMKNNGKDTNIKKFLDTYQFKFDKLDMTSGEYALSITGEVQKYLNVIFPTFDLNVRVNKYTNLVDYYFENLNLSVEQLSKLPNSPVKEKISPTQVNKVKSILAKFSNNDDVLNMHFTGSKYGVFEISGRPLLEVWTELQAIIFANIKEEPLSKTKVGK